MLHKSKPFQVVVVICDNAGDLGMTPEFADKSVL